MFLCLTDFTQYNNPRFIYVVECDGISFFSKAEQYCIVCAYYFTGSCIGGHLDYFHLLAMVNNPKYVYTTPLLSEWLLNYMIFIFLIF